MRALQVGDSLGAVSVTGRVNVTPPSDPDSLCVPSCWMVRHRCCCAAERISVSDQDTSVLPVTRGGTENRLCHSELTTCSKRRQHRSGGMGRSEGK